MRIEGEYMKRIMDLLQVRKAEKEGKKVEEKRGDKGSDKVEISSLSLDMVKFRRLVEEIPDIREDLVRAFKEMIEKGEYNPPMEKVVESMIRRMMADDEKA